MAEMSKRDWQYIQEPEKVGRLIKEKIKKSTFYLKKTDPAAEIYRGPDRPNNEFEFHYSPDLILGDTFTIFTTLNRQLEIDFKKNSIPSEGVVYATPIQARISMKQREEKRILVTDNSVSAAHFQVSKSDLAVNNSTPHVTNKVIYAEFERILGPDYPGIQIFDFANKDRPEETNFLNRSIQSIYVEDLQSDADLKKVQDGCLNYYEYLDFEDKLDIKLKEYRDNQNQSLIVKPILYQGMGDVKKPIAFFYLLTKRGETIYPSILEKLDKVSEDIISRIRDSNLLNIDDRQTVNDISPKGISLWLTNKDLVKYIPNSRVVTFDLIFKMQAPLRFRGIVRHMRKLENKMLVGISLEGTAHNINAGKKNALDRLANMIQHIQ